jgi:hypothetical protein
MMNKIKETDIYKKLKKVVVRIKPLYKILSYTKRKFKSINESSQLMPLNELNFLLKVSGRGNDIIEIGAATGQTTKRLAMNNQVITIDPFLVGEDGLLMSKYEKDFHHEFLSNIKGKNIIFFNMGSEGAFKIWDQKIKRKIYGVFIDGEHTYEAVKNDSKWIKYVKDGGFIAFHDVEYENGIRNFVEKIIVPKYKLIGKEGNLWIFRKVKKKVR